MNLFVALTITWCVVRGAWCVVRGAWCVVRETGNVNIVFTRGIEFTFHVLRFT
jgi:hypothetical protein